MTGCDRCDDQNVQLPSVLPDDELHRAWHELIRPIEHLLADKAVSPLARALWFAHSRKARR